MKGNKKSYWFGYERKKNYSLYKSFFKNVIKSLYKLQWQSITLILKEKGVLSSKVNANIFKLIKK